MNLEKQIAFWKDGSVSNLESAEILLAKGKRLESLFFCHLALEKILKAHAIKKTRALPPKHHNLLRLQELADITLDESLVAFLAEMNEFAIEARYPIPFKEVPSLARCQQPLSKTQGIPKWLVSKLSA